MTGRGETVTREIDPADPDPGVLAEAGEVLRRGGLVAFPTETVYGLGADAMDGAAVGRIFAAKGRPPDNPLIVHVASVEALEEVVEEVTPLARELAARFWPGPLTLVLRAGAAVPTETRGGLETVAVRVPDHPVALGLIAAAGVPVAAPSANRSGRPSPTGAAHVARDLRGDIDLILDAGPCEIGVESTVVDARGAEPVVLREGAVTREDLRMEGDRRTRDDGSAAASPGTRYRHYAPDCQVVLAPAGKAAEHAAERAAAGERVGLVARHPATASPEVRTILVYEDAAELAHRLYGALRETETEGLDVLVVESVPEEGIGRAVMDRLRRASGG